MEIQSGTTEGLRAAADHLAAFARRATAVARGSEVEQIGGTADWAARVAGAEVFDPPIIACTPCVPRARPF